jgi:hypothetical protein
MFGRPHLPKRAGVRAATQALDLGGLARHRRIETKSCVARERRGQRTLRTCGPRHAVKATINSRRVAPRAASQDDHVACPGGLSRSK